MIPFAPLRRWPALATPGAHALRMILLAIPTLAVPTLAVPTLATTTLAGCTSEPDLSTTGTLSTADAALLQTRAMISSPGPVDGASNIVQSRRTLEPSPAPRTASSSPVYGVADLHNHQFAEYAYQGAWFHGTTLGPEGGDETWAGLSACDGNTPDGPQDHAMSYLNVLCGVAGWVTDDMCRHEDRTFGYAGGEQADLSYSGWPHATSWAHQQTWWGHLKAAHEDGLALTVVHAVNFETLCDIMEPSNYQYFYDCKDMGVVDLQLEAAKAFAAIHHDWVEIAYTPQDARRIHSEGKLVMVLAIEITDLFPTGEMDYAPMVYDAQGNLLDRGGVLTQLNYYYDQGVRSIQLAHELDSRFAGVALYSPVFKLVEAILKIQEQHPGELADVKIPGDGAPDLGMNLTPLGYNRKGLTDEGRILLQEMMRLGMLVDIAHLSHNSVEDVYAVAQENAYYPLFHSHAKLAEIMVLPGEQPLEKYTPDWVVEEVNATGGMIALRTFGAKVNSYAGSGVENNCDGSSRSFAQAVAYGDQALGAHLTLGVDFNGFADQTGPRFGEKSCAKAESESAQLEQQAQQDDAGTGTHFDRQGLGHMGLVGRGLLQDLRNVGLDTGNLEQSAEHVIQMWERSIDPNRTGPVGTPPTLHRRNTARR